MQPETSTTALEAITNCAENILRKLELPFRIIALCAGDMNFNSIRTYDIEVWIPIQNVHREIDSCPNMDGFQARRMQAYFHNAQGKPELVHMPNGSGLAVGHTLVALLENYQNVDDSVTMPTTLRPYLDDQEALKPIV